MSRHEPFVDIEKNRTERIRCKFREFEGGTFLDIRNWYLAETSDKWVPSRKGVCIPAGMTEDLIKALGRLVNEESTPWQDRNETFS